jgi:hypothetical protein
MITKISDTNKFQPVTVTIVIESLEELKALWHRTNIHMDKIEEAITNQCSVEFPDGDYHCSDLWLNLNNLADELGLKDHLK